VPVFLGDAALGVLTVHKAAPYRFPGWGPHEDGAPMPDVDLRLSKPPRLAVLQAALARVTAAAWPGLEPCPVHS
jgi:hypothetical protein